MKTRNHSMLSGPLFGSIILGVCGIRIGWVLTVFRAFHTPQCLFISYPISWTITFAIQLFAFFVVFRRHEAGHAPQN